MAPPFLTLLVALNAITATARTVPPVDNGQNTSLEDVNKDNLIDNTYENLLPQVPATELEPGNFDNGPNDDDLVVTSKIDDILGRRAPRRPSRRPAFRHKNRPDGSSNRHDDSSNNGPSNAPNNFPKEGPSDAPKNSPKDSPNNGPNDAPENGPKDSPKDAPTDAPKDSPKNNPSDAPKDAPKDSPNNSPSNAPKDSPKNGPSDAPKNSPKDNPSDVPKDAPQDSPNNGPQDADKNAQLNQLQKISEWVEVAANGASLIDSTLSIAKTSIELDDGRKLLPNGLVYDPKTKKQSTCNGTAVSDTTTPPVAGNSTTALTIKTPVALCRGPSDGQYILSNNYTYNEKTNEYLGNGKGWHSIPDAPKPTILGNVKWPASGVPSVQVNAAPKVMGLRGGKCFLNATHFYINGGNYWTKEVGWYVDLTAPLPDTTGHDCATKSS
ncbi:hypothetical protein VFPPC_13296 [Pochonia chlamydosporia 170]|uniref:Cell wall protein n=1 Tax=Pochonia chlamydosporia 170 TaxID=1380566 RepID=A0A179FY55_METCM|nr:hypothetical protein VFPPC_13296 [Pochonia chlamydosporia 170]OAQ70041.1 hypothetical protein VFPPC_13296 [Pochonia chlamydosporia 170]